MSFAACVAVVVSVVVSGCGTTAPEVATPEYLAEIEQWRADREDGLKTADGWLTLVGLFWLETGESGFGSDPALPLAFPEGSTALNAGVLEYDGETVRLRAAEGVEITVNDEAVTEAVLGDDSQGTPDQVRVGRLLLYSIQRDGKHAIRVKDPESETRLSFEGLDWFPIDTAYRVAARFDAFPEPQAVEIPTAAGTKAPMFIPGIAKFELKGQTHELQPLVGEPGETELFFILRDKTSGTETYGAGRYLYGTLEANEVVLDFNKAYNPPCVFTPYATCPLPPRKNQLQIPINAGEKNYGSH